MNWVIVQTVSLDDMAKVRPTFEQDESNYKQKRDRAKNVNNNQDRDETKSLKQCLRTPLKSSKLT